MICSSDQPDLRSPHGISPIDAATASVVFLIDADSVFKPHGYQHLLLAVALSGKCGLGIRADFFGH